MWGRLTGLVFLVPAAAFFARGWVTRYLRPRLLVQGSLLVFQVSRALRFRGVALSFRVGFLFEALLCQCIVVSS